MQGGAGSNKSLIAEAIKWQEIIQVLCAKEIFRENLI
jgi:hypothetical protein